MILLLYTGCVSFSIRPPDLPVNQLEEITLCQSVDTSEDPWQLKDISPSFFLHDGTLACFVKVRYVEDEIKLRWKWYSPQNLIAKDTGDVTVNTERQYLDEVTAFDIFRYIPERDHIGRWIVVFYIDNTLVGKRTFQIQEKQPPESNLPNYF
jgi:hypothetical protein